MDIRKIIKEEIDDFQWMKDIPTGGVIPYNEGYEQAIAVYLTDPSHAEFVYNRLSNYGWRFRSGRFNPLDYEDGVEGFESIFSDNTQEGTLTYSMYDNTSWERYRNDIIEIWDRYNDADTLHLYKSTDDGEIELIETIYRHELEEDN